jgi:NAD-dependent SIR2 family protein deacetylase
MIGMSVNIQKREKQYYEGKEIRLMCQGCGSEKKENYGHATMEIVAIDRYDQKASISLCPGCLEEIRKQILGLEI